MPAWLRHVRARIKYRRFDSELAEEIETHRAMAERDLSAAGESPEEARWRSARQLGNATLARQESRDVWIPRVWQRWKTDALWAARGLRARTWRAPLIIALLGFALTANTLLFAVADTLLFRPVAYRDPDRLVSLVVRIPHRSLQTLLLSPPTLLDDLRARHDVFQDVHAYIRGTYTFIMDPVSPKQVPTTFVTPGLIEMLGGKPLSGRMLTETDAAQTNVRTALISEDLAAERFGAASQAVGRELTTSDDPLLVVGVIPREFQFPDSTARIYRPLDYRRATTGAIFAAARLAPGMTQENVGPSLAAMSAAIAGTASVPASGELQAVPILPATMAPRALVLTLIGAGLCLLIIACANVVSLEIAGAMNRSRTLGIQIALGATTSNLVRTGVIEGAAIVGGAATLSWWGVHTLQTQVGEWLPARLTRFAVNPVDLDPRALAFMVGLAGLAWLAVSLPVAWHISRQSVARTLSKGSHQTSAARGTATVRKALTMIEVALAIVLMIGGVLYTRTYEALIGVDKGFDSTNIVSIDMTLPTAVYAAPGAVASLRTRTLDLLTQRRGVLAMTDGSQSVFDVGMTIRSLTEVDDRPPLTTPTTFALRTVDETFFQTMGLKPVRGRTFGAGEDPTNVVITAALAEKFWPGVDPIGHHLRTQPNQPWLTVIGLVNHVRYTAQKPGEAGYDSYFELYVPRRTPTSSKPGLTHVTQGPPPADQPGPRPNVPREGAIFMFLDFLVRLDPGVDPSTIERDLRKLDTRFGLDVKAVDAAYAAANLDRLLAARVVGGFALLSFAVAMAGLYGVMAFLVAGRRREMGIRLALGARHRQVRQLVLGSAMRLVFVGAALGLLGAVALSKWLQSQLYGVQAIDLSTYATVVVLVAAAATLATWLPARQASRVDPATTLRQE